MAALRRRYEERPEGVASAEPGAVIRVEAGERMPRAARVIEGTGSVLGGDGLPLPVAPGGRVPASVLVAALTVPPVRHILSLVTPTPLGWTLVGTVSVGAVLLNRVLASAGGARRLFPPLAPAGERGILAPPAEPLLLPAPAAPS